MKKYLFLLLSLSTTVLVASVYVDGYTKADGTYVEGHYRSSPNDTVSDNYSTDGNVNPYTGEEGYRNVDDDSYDNTGGSDYSEAPIDTSSPSDNTALIIGGVILGLIVVIAILRMLARILFVSYLVANAKVVFWTWVVLTLLNQVVFFGACLQPYCILASIPHVSLLTFGIMYLMYKSALTTYDPKTGYNQFGYDKDGYNQYGYDKFGYDKHGYNAKGLDRDGEDQFRDIRASIEKAKLQRKDITAVSTSKEKDAKIQGSELDIKQTEKKSETMELEAYKNISDQDENIKNFRLYYQNKPTNLVWYSGKIIYVPKDYFLMKDLVNINHAIGEKCTLYKSDIELIDELKEKHIVFALAEDLEDLMNRINAINVKGLLSEELGIETTSDVDYSEFHESIHDENGSWKIKF